MGVLDRSRGISAWLRDDNNVYLKSDSRADIAPEQSWPFRRPDNDTPLAETVRVVNVQGLPWVQHSTCFNPLPREHSTGIQKRDLIPREVKNTSRVIESPNDARFDDPYSLRYHQDLRSSSEEQ